MGLKGGVCFFLWDRENPGQCRVTTHFTDGTTSTATRPLQEEGVDVFIRFNEGLSILKKVVARESGPTRSLLLPEGKRFDPLVSSRKPFGFDTTFKGKATKSRGDVPVYRRRPAVMLMAPVLSRCPPVPRGYTWLNVRCDPTSRRGGGRRPASRG